jgi:hypothetical protein
MEIKTVKDLKDYLEQYTDDMPIMSDSGQTLTVAPDETGLYIF